MDLRLTWRGDYTVRAAVALAAAHADGGWVKASDLSESTGIPRTYVSQILSALARGDLVEARAGRQGGYRLRRTPRDISLLEVVEAGEGELRSRRCVLRGSACGEGSPCAIHPHWVRAQDALRDELAATSLARIAGGVTSAPGRATARR